ncbi:MAG TPA: DUF4258 domain-containing protein [Syntrophales bacterium]|nr:DUF4258 domain-containing protein [Syntrophales bacterium]HRT26687.1 DUF4258 domain-containing protein [Syntrophales bacterium]HRT70228.1 DUF4258 domain-containing protein [Syntrophales bacterium]
MNRQSADEILDVIRGILTKSGSITIPGHAKRRMEERNYTVQDVFNIIEKGSLGPLQTSEKPGEERYEIIGNDLDGHPGAVIVEISPDRNKIILITVKGGV